MVSGGVVLFCTICPTNTSMSPVERQAALPAFPPVLRAVPSTRVRSSLVTWRSPRVTTSDGGSRVLRTRMPFARRRFLDDDICLRFPAWIG